MYVKNDKINIHIVDMAESSEGIGKVDSLVFFVKNAVIGDYVNAVITKVTKNIIYAKALDIIENSKYRVNAPCDVYKLCGGCTLLNVDYDTQIKIKEENFFRKLKNIAGFTDYDIKNIYKGFVKCDNNLYYRNKIQLPLGRQNDSPTNNNVGEASCFPRPHIISGFYKPRTHEIIENDICHISFKNSDKIINIIKKEIENFSVRHDDLIYNENTHTGIFREIFLRTGNKSNELSITLIVNDKNYKKNLSAYKTLAENISNAVGASPLTITLNINTNKTNVLFGNENIVLLGPGYINDTILDTKFKISPQSFYQINKFMTDKLYSVAIDFIKEENVDLKDFNVYDLYCGIGTISLIFSKYVRHITGIEIVEEAINNANENKKINNIKNADFIVKNAEKLTKDDIKDCDLIIVDPPRKGLTENLINTIKSLSPTYLLYISCDQGTLSRDLKMFNDDKTSIKYEAKKIKCVDMFPHTMHAETVVLLKRK